MIQKFVKRILPKKYHDIARRLYFLCRYVIYFGHSVSCPICHGHFRKFIASKYKTFRPRLNAKCPKCGVMERHRLLWLYLRNRTDFFTNHLRVLDVAPMYSFQEICRKMKNLDYISVDISSPIAMIKMDITDMGFPDNHFDYIICYQVLQHIPDDRKAMRELFRVLKPGGYVLIHSAVDHDRRDEYILPSEKTGGVFVRVYGQNYKGKLERSGFTVEFDNYTEELGDQVIRGNGLIENDIIVACTKPTSI